MSLEFAQEESINGTYSFDFILKVLRYEYTFWPENLSLLGFLLIVLALLSSGSTLILAYTTRKLHKTRVVPTSWRKVILSLLAFLASFAVLAVYSAVVLEDFFNFMRMAHSPANVLRATGGRTSSNVPFVVIPLFLLWAWQALLRFDPQIYYDRRVGILSRHDTKRDLNTVLWRSRQTYLDRYRGVGADYALYLHFEQEEDVYGPLGMTASPKRYENHDAPYELRITKYKKGGIVSARPRFAFLSNYAPIFEPALADFLYNLEDIETRGRRPKPRDTS